MVRKLILLSSILVSSCGTTKLPEHDLADINAGKKSIVKTYNQPLVAGMILGDEPVTMILSIDGKKLASAVLKLDEQVAVETGTRTIKFGCSKRSGHDDRDFTKLIKLDIKPHHEYLVRCSFDSSYGANGTYTGDFSVKEKRVK